MLCVSSDIIFLQETWLTDFDTQFLAIISDELYAKGISSMGSSIHLVACSPDGGLGILWRKSLGENCNIVDARLLGIEIVIKNNDDEIKLLFVNIYMLFDCVDNTDDFMQYLSRVNDIFKYILLHMCTLLVNLMLPSKGTNVVLNLVKRY